jgi:hypothetical protein
MPTLRVDTLSFHFAPSINAQKYDESNHYQMAWRLQGKMAMDVVAMRMGGTPDPLWLIEAKDFRVITRQPEASNLSGLAQTVATKAADTLEGLSDAAANAADAAEKQYASRATSAVKTRIVLHLEPHVGQHTKLFPSSFSGGVLQKLRQLVQNVDPKPLVLNIADTPKAGVPWTVS